MRHRIARHLLGLLCDRGAFDPPLVAATFYAMRCDSSQGDPLLDTALSAAIRAPVQETLAIDPCSQALHDDVDATAEQLTRLVTERPCWIGDELARLTALTELWSHATRGERMQLRRLWLAGLSARTAPTAAWSDRETLCTWQSRLPTIFQDEPPSAANLSGILSAADPEQAYRLIAVHLGPDLDLEQLASVLGVLAQRILLRRFDRQGRTHTAYLGAVALRRLIPRLDPDTALVAICQLAHQIWWCAQRSSARSLLRGSTDFGLDLAAAVRAGDYTASQRAARQLAVDEDRFWSQSTNLVCELAESDDAEWPRAVMALTSAACRCERSHVAPDDAATLAATLAAIHWLGQPAEAFG